MPLNYRKEEKKMKKTEVIDLYAYSESELKNMIRRAVLIDRKYNKKRKREERLEEIKSNIAMTLFAVGLPLCMFAMWLMLVQKGK